MAKEMMMLMMKMTKNANCRPVASPPVKKYMINFCFQGTNLPYRVYDARCVQHGDTFFIIGGKGSSELIDTILVYDVALSSWSELPTRMTAARKEAAALLISPAMFPECYN